MNNQSTLSYILQLKKDRYMADFFTGYPDLSSNKVIYGDEKLAAKQL